MGIRKRFGTIALILILVNIAGVLGYRIIEGWSLFDSFYMTVITIGTVGYGETQPLTTGGRVFTIGLIFVGIGTFTYALSSVTAFWVEVHLFGLWRRHQMDRRIAALNDHIILCGGGETAVHIVQELQQTETPFVIIEQDLAQAERLPALGEDVLFIVGDASENAILRRARIETARGLVACMPDDKDNLFTVFEARDMNPRLRIVSRLVENDARHKLERAGADGIVPMLRIGALRMASEVLRPHVVSVLDVMLREPSLIRVQEIPVGDGAAGQSLGDLNLLGRTGITVFAMREAGNLRHVFNPLPDRILQAGDILIGCADAEQIAKARRIAAEG